MKETTYPSDTILLNALSREAIAKIAPEEMPLFEATSETYRKNPKLVFSKQNDKEEMLGFGVGTTVTLLTPIALEVSKIVINYVIEISRDPIESAVQDSIQKQAPGIFDRLARFISQLLGKTEPPVELMVSEVPALNRDQLVQVQQLAFEKAQQFNLPADQAILLAESLVGSLAIMA